MDIQYLVEFLQAAAITSGWLLPIVIGLVTYFGKLGISGKWQLVSSLATGLVLGGLVMFAQSQPKTLMEWIGVAAYGIILGLTASGVYETGKELALKRDTSPAPDPNDAFPL